MVAHINHLFYAHVSILGPNSSEFFWLSAFSLTEDFFAGILFSILLHNERGENGA